METHKALIISDTHGRGCASFRRLIAMHHPEAVIHCGDLEGEEDILREAAGCPMYMVTGNNDYFSSLPRELEFTLFGRKIWLTHGHHYYVSMAPDIIRDEAISRGVDIVFYGHTHRPDVYRGEQIISANPGSLCYPRQEGRKPSYLIMETDRENELHFTVAYLDA